MVRDQPKPAAVQDAQSLYFLNAGPACAEPVTLQSATSARTSARHEVRAAMVVCCGVTAWRPYICREAKVRMKIMAFCA